MIINPPDFDMSVDIFESSDACRHILELVGYKRVHGRETDEVVFLHREDFSLRQIEQLVDGITVALKRLNNPASQMSSK